jgi:NADH:ubiquinone oxidoreductase subunit K
MKIKIAQSGISFGSLVKLVSTGFFIGWGILLPLIFAALSFTEYHRPLPPFVFLMFPVLIAIQSLLTAVIVALGVKLYGKLSKFEISSFEEKV